MLRFAQRSPQHRARVASDATFVLHDVLRIDGDVHG
jgi:hypothetical protein